jgi:hypothetical protein
MILTAITTIIKDEVNVAVHGPFENHAKANGWMQREYDTLMGLTSHMGIEGDDSDASHFYAKSDDLEIHWQIVEAKPIF